MKNMLNLVTNRWSRTISIGVLLTALVVALLAGPEIGRVFAGSNPAVASIPAAANAEPTTGAANRIAMLEDGCPGCGYWPFIDCGDEPVCCLCRLLHFLKYLMEHENELEGGTDPTTINANMEYVTNYYVNHGFLTGLTQQERTDGLAALNALEDILDQDPLPSGIDDEIAADLLNVIPDMRDDLD